MADHRSSSQITFYVFVSHWGCGDQGGEVDHSHAE